MTHLAFHILGVAIDRCVVIYWPEASECNSIVFENFRGKLIQTERYNAAPVNCKQAQIPSASPKIGQASISNQQDCSHSLPAYKPLSLLFFYIFLKLYCIICYTCTLSFILHTKIRTHSKRSRPSPDAQTMRQV